MEAPNEDEVVLKVRNKVAILRLSKDVEKIATLTPGRMESLLRSLKQIEKNDSLVGLVFVGSGPKGFCAGADVSAIRDVTDPAVGRQLAQQGQEIFSKIERLGIRTVCAIGGACVGGGFEMALACDYRIAIDLPETKVGLPETKLGIIPGFGGTQRLPRLVGLPKSLDVILAGKTLPGKRALKSGLIDKLFDLSGDGKSLEEQYKELEKIAVRIASGEENIRGHAMSFQDQLLTFFGLGRSIVSSQAKKTISKTTKGKYPAPPRALEIACLGLANGVEAGYQAEAEALGELVVTPECKSLVHIYFLTQAAGKLGAHSKAELENVKVGVVGAGTMGAGIAGALVSKGISCTIVDTFEKARERAGEFVKKCVEKLRSLSEAQKEAYLAQFKVEDDLRTLYGQDIVIEAAIEDMEAKKGIFSVLSEGASESALLATNTSSLSVAEISEAVSNPERVIGMHFFNPAEKMPLVEVVRGQNTGARGVALTCALASKMGKYPVVVEDGAGFLVNRVLSPYLMEAAHLLAEGVSVSDIDAAAESFGMPMGPIRLLDEIGLDVAAKVSKIMAKAYGKRMEGPDFSTRLLELGRLGKKSGSGFYLYNDGEAELDPDLATTLQLPTLPSSPLEKEAISDRLILPMVNEAVRCFDEGVAGVPSKEAAGQIDLATVMGTGFAPFRGGVLFYASSRGAKDIHARLNEFEQHYGDRLRPCMGISRRAEMGKAFDEVLPVNGSSV